MVMGFESECPICYDYKCCLPLKCGHKFCRPCLTNTMKYFNIEKNNHFMCPYCRAKITKIKNNKLNKQLQELYREIKLRQTDPQGYGFYIIYIEIIDSMYYFPKEKEKYNYPIKFKFYTFEDMIK